MITGLRGTDQLRDVHHGKASTNKVSMVQETDAYTI